MSYIPLVIPISIAQGGTNATDAATARSNLGLAIGTNVQAYSDQLTSIAGIGNGIPAHTATNTFTPRTLTGTSNQVIIANGDGVSGNPTFSTPQDIATSSKPTFAGVISTAQAATSGQIGEQLTTGYQSAISLSTATPFNLGSLSVTAGLWMFYAFILYRTTSSVSGNTQWYCTFNTTSATLPGDGLQSVNIGGISPRNGGNDITVSHCFYKAVTTTTTWYCVGQGSGSSVFNSVTGNGAFWAVRVG